MNGVVVVNKSEGMSSAQVVARVKRLLQADKAGHTGTLDPFARGVLVCCINQATRLARFLQRGGKAYAGVLTLGAETDTEDASGRVVAEGDWSGLSAVDIERAFQRYEGCYPQTPPAYSALKHQGVPLYVLARQGRPMRKPPREVYISSLRVLGVELPQVRFEVCCSAGTYVRTLCADVGRTLGCGGHLSALTRLETGGFTLAQAFTLERLEDLSRRGALAEAVVPMAAALADMPEITAGPLVLEHIRHGRRLTLEDLDRSAWSPAAGVGEASIKVVDDRGELAAVLRWTPGANELDYSAVFMQPQR